jgi:uncharacterized delta-60 repeat protein
VSDEMTYYDKRENRMFGTFKHTYSGFGCLFFVLMCALKTDAQQLIWQRIFDTGKADYCAGVATDDQGNIIIAGTTIPGEISPPNHDDFLIIKYNPFGDTLWTRQYNVTIADDAHGIVTDHLGNVIVTGCIVNDSTNADIHIIKFNPNGDILWTRTYSNGVREYGEFSYGVTVDSKNNIIVTGKGSSSGLGLPDYVTLKYDSNGNLLWVKYYDGGWEDVAKDVAVDDSDNVIVTGYSDSDINWDWCTIKYSPRGDIIWVKRYDVSLDDWAHGVATDKEGNVIVCGEIHRGNVHTGVAVKYTPQGDTLWIKKFIDTLQFAEVSEFIDVTTDSRGNIYLVGDYGRWDTTGKLWVDYYIAKCTPHGDTVWTTRCGAGWENRASGITLDRWGIIIVAGTKYPSPDGFSNEVDYQTIKLANVIDAVYDERTHLKDFYLSQNYPNPFNPTTVITYRLPVNNHVSLKVFDLLGREVDTLVTEEKAAGTYTTTWNAARFSSGVYVARLTTRTFVASVKIILMK